MANGKWWAMAGTAWIVGCNLNTGDPDDDGPGSGSGGMQFDSMGGESPIGDGDGDGDDSDGSGGEPEDGSGGEGGGSGGEGGGSGGEGGGSGGEDGGSGGEDGGSGGTMSEESFRVLATAPSDGASSVPRATNPTVTFSTRPHSATVTAQSFTIDNGVVTRSGDFSFLGDDAGMDLTPNLGPAQYYTVNLTTDIEDSDGNPLAAPASFSFTTEDGEYLSPRTLEVSEGTVFAHAAANRSGYRAVLYEDDQGEEHRLLVAHAPAGQFLTATPIFTGSEAPRRGTLIVTEDGAIIVLVEMWHDPLVDLLSYTYDPQAGWGEPEPLLEDVEWVNIPKTHVDAAGNVVMIANYSVGSAGIPFAIHHRPGVGWGSVEILNEGTQNVDVPALAGNDAGQLVASWVNYTDRVVYANYYDPIAGWLGAEPVGEYGNLAPGITDASIDAEGSAIVVHRRHAESQTDIFANRFEAQDGWTGSLLIENNASTSSRPEGIGSDAQGDFWVLWTSGEAEEVEAQLFLSRYEAGEGWLAPTPIATNATSGWQIVHPSGLNALVWVEGAALHGAGHTAATGLGEVSVLAEDVTGYPLHEAQLAMDGIGNGLFVVPCGPTSVCAARFGPAVGWSELETVETSTGTARVSGLALDGEGRATIAWVEHDAGAGTVHSLDFR